MTYEDYRQTLNIFNVAINDLFQTISQNRN